MSAHVHREGCHVFRFVTFRWCVDQARELIESDPDAARREPVEIEPLREFTSLGAPRPGHLKLIEVKVDAAHAATVDLTEPIVFAPIVSPETGERMGGFLIDGWHRVYRALSEGVPELPAYFLTDEASLAVLVPWE
ncbi:MAG TPA: hypothetical protein VFW65_32035 [Pseudonocardiaceae bacterium]|nr:hypothetical protein [Pseudonocardiaceae bacterium]